MQLQVAKFGSNMFYSIVIVSKAVILLLAWQHYGVIQITYKCVFKSIIYISAKSTTKLNMFSRFRDNNFKCFKNICEKKQTWGKTKRYKIRISKLKTRFKDVYCKSVVNSRPVYQTSLDFNCTANQGLLMKPWQQTMNVKHSCKRVKSITTSLQCCKIHWENVNSVPSKSFLHPVDSWGGAHGAEQTLVASAEN